MPFRHSPWAILLLATVALAAEPAVPVAPGAKPEKLADGFLFTEGPSVDKDGNV